MLITEPSLYAEVGSIDSVVVCNDFDAQLSFGPRDVIPLRQKRLLHRSLANPISENLNSAALHLAEMLA